MAPNTDISTRALIITLKSPIVSLQSFGTQFAFQLEQTYKGQFTSLTYTRTVPLGFLWRAACLEAVTAGKIQTDVISSLCTFETHPQSSKPVRTLKYSKCNS